MERNSWFKALVVLLVLIGAWYLLGQFWALAERFSDIILLFFLAWVIAFMLSPVARLLSRGFGLPRGAAVALVYMALVIGLLSGGILLVPIITEQLSQLGNNLGGYTEQIPVWVENAEAELLRRNIHVDLAGLYGRQDFAARFEQFGTLAIGQTIGIVTGLASAMFSLIIVLVLSFYMLADGNRLTDKVSRAVPPHVREELHFLQESVDRVFGGFLRGQIIQCVIYGVGTAIVMVAAGLSYVLVSSLFAGAVMLIPFVGPVIALGPPLLLAAMQGSFAKFVAVAIGLLILQQIVVNVIAPKLLSHSVGLPPLLVLLAMLLGAKIAGLVGAIFGVPFAAVGYAMLVFLYRRTALAEAAAQAHREDPLRRDVEFDEPVAIAWLGRQGRKINERLAAMAIGGRRTRRKH